MSDLEQTAIERLKFAAHASERYYHAPLIVTDSGGKDSSVCVALAQRAGIDFEVMHNLTTADAPETVRFVRQEFKRLEETGIKCTVSYPYYKGVRTSMWALIPQKLMPPTRIARYCCEVLKEHGGDGSYIVTGVRYAESAKRAKTRGIYEAIIANKADKIILTNDNDDKRRLFEHCVRRRKHVCNPIVDWTDHDVWDYIHAENIPVNPLYDCGFSRVGCIGCPLASKRMQEIEFARYPKYKQAYIRAFGKMLEERKRRGKLNDDSRWWNTAQEVFNWWMNYNILPGQTSLFKEDEPP